MVLSRLAQGVAVLAVTSVIVFAALCRLPGDPLELAVALDPQASPDEVARVRAVLELDRPWPARYLRWLWGHAEARPAVVAHSPPPLTAVVDGTGTFTLDIDLRPLVDASSRLSPGTDDPAVATVVDGHLRARLPPGEHRLVFVATDDAGQSAAGVVSVQVADVLPVTAPEHDVTDIERQLAGGTEGAVEHHEQTAEELASDALAHTGLLPAVPLDVDATMTDVAVPRSALWERSDGLAATHDVVTVHTRDALLDATLDDDALHLHARGPGQGVVLVTRTVGERSLVTAVNVRHGVVVDATQFHRGALFVLVGDVDAWGMSRTQHVPALQVVGARLVNTVVLVVPALLCAWLLALGFGTWSAAHVGGVVDRVVRLTSLGVSSTPTFVIGGVLLVLFVQEAHLLPVGGLETPGASGGFVDVTLDRARHALLPVLTLTCVWSAHLVAIVRAAVDDVAHTPYLRAALARGLSPARVWLAHALRAALHPIVVAFASTLPHAVAGAVLTETVFAWPGLGRLLVDAVHAHDTPVVMAAVLATAGAVVVAELVGDLVLVLVDPTLRRRP